MSTRVNENRATPVRAETPSAPAAPQQSRRAARPEISAAQKLAGNLVKAASSFGSAAPAFGRRFTPESQAGQHLPSAAPRNLGFDTGAQWIPSTAEVSPNVNVSNEAGPQSETDIAIDPTDPNHLLGGSNSITSDGAMRVYESFDGGQTWTDGKLPLAPKPLNAFTSDPAVTFDKKGNAYYSFLGIDSQGQRTTLVNLVKPKGSDKWGQMTTVPNVNADKQFMTSDTTDGPHAGNVYIAWDNNNKDNTQKVQLATSSDGGKSWTVANVNNQGDSVIGSDPKIGPNGEVYVAWANYKDHTLNINVSKDGGKTFSPTDTTIHKWTAPTGSGLDVKIPADPERGVTTFPSIDVDRSNGPNRGTLYASYMDGDAANGYHVYVQSSKDGGKTWSSPAKIDDDSGKHDHFMPRLAVDQSDGSVNVIWYDTRNDAANKKADVYYSRSTDGGATWEANAKITSAPSDETTSARAGVHGGVHAGGRVEDDDEDGHERTTDDVLSDANGYGDYLGIAASNGKVEAFWTDSRAGTKEEDVYSATITHKTQPPPPPPPPGPVVVEVKGAQSPAAPIKDLQTTTSKIHFDDQGSIDALKLSLDISHTWRGDLVVQLTSPSGKTVDISNRQGGSADDIKGDFDLSKQFAGESIAGDWTLTVRDAAKRDEGTLNGWALDAQVKTPSPGLAA